MIEWNQQMSVSIPVIDKQHRNLIDQVQQLFAAVQNGAGEHKVREMFNEFLKLAAVHFSTEEKMMGEYRYPGAVLHQREHRRIAVFADEFRDMFDEGMVPLSMDLLGFLSDVLEKHIMNTDKCYSQYFIENGICVSTGSA
jgi:hemerythrin